MARSANEAKFWGIIRPMMPRDTWFRRIEDASGNLGTPDLFVCRGVRSCWIELKAAKVTHKPALRPGQQATHLSLFSAGYPSCYLVGYERGPVRMIGAQTNGDDWREHLIEQWDAPSSSVIQRVLTLMGV
jgi:hypothetical protein